MNGKGVATGPVHPISIIAAAPRQRPGRSGEPTPYAAKSRKRLRMAFSLLGAVSLTRAPVP
jgi:hypothetical protein